MSEVLLFQKLEWRVCLACKKRNFRVTERSKQQWCSRICEWELAKASKNKAKIDEVRRENQVVRTLPSQESKNFLFKLSYMRKGPRHEPRS